jgi:hypothetical protein
MHEDRSDIRRRRVRAMAALGVTVVALIGAGCTTKELETTDTSVTTSSTAGTSSTTTTQRTGTTQTTGGGGTTSTSVIPIEWSLNALEYRGQNGLRVTVQCPPGGTPYSVWGVGTYTDDSSICTAGVHHGLITFESGGTVEIEIAPGQQSYEGSTANGVTSSSYPAWDGSYRFVE